MLGSELKAFRGGQEHFVLGLPFILFILIALEILLDLKFNTAERKFSNFIADILFFDTTHAVLTFLLILFVPEVSGWKEKVSQKGTFLKFGIGIFIFWLILFLFQRFNDSGVIFTIVSTITVFYPVYHCIAQVRGISFTYNTIFLKNQQGIENKDSILRSYRYEKWVGNLLVFTISLKLILSFLQMEKGFKIGNYGVLVDILNVSLILLLLFLFLSLPKQLRIKKIIFNSRILIFLFVPSSFIAKIGYQINHGTEYVSIVDKMIENSSISSANRRKLIYFFLTAIIVLSTLAYPQFILNPNFFGSSSESIFKIFLAMRAANTYTHYFFDGLLFKMKNPITRERIAPLLS